MSHNEKGGRYMRARFTLADVRAHAIQIVDKDGLGSLSMPEHLSADTQPEWAVPVVAIGVLPVGQDELVEQHADDAAITWR